MGERVSVDANWAGGDFEAGRVVVWQADLDRPAAEVERLRALLSADERERASRFSSPVPQRRFIVARGFLRSVLGRYTGTTPQAVRFGYGAEGKPFLQSARGLAADAPPSFNLAHCEELALLGVRRANGCRVGVDVERVRPFANLWQVADRFYSPAERARLRSLPAAEAAAAFFGYWTAKEAFLKAIGAGLTVPLDSVEVDLAGTAPARFVHVGGDEREAALWQVYAFTPRPGFTGAVVTEDGAGFELRAWGGDCG